MPGKDMPRQVDDREADMARADLYKCANYSFKLFKMIEPGQELEGWVQAKITKAADYIASVYHYMEYEMKFNEYGRQLENSDMYTESVKRQFAQKLTEARTKMDQLKDKNIKDLAEKFVVKDSRGKTVFTSTSEAAAKKKATALTKSTGKKHTCSCEDAAKPASKASSKDKAVSTGKKGTKPDFLDIDKDGDRKEPMKSAAATKKQAAAKK